MPASLYPNRPELKERIVTREGVEYRLLLGAADNIAYFFTKSWTVLVGEYGFGEQAVLLSIPLKGNGQINWTASPYAVAVITLFWEGGWAFTGKLPIRNELEFRRLLYNTIGPDKNGRLWKCL